MTLPAGPADYDKIVKLICEDKSTPWTVCDLPGYENRTNELGYLETRPKVKNPCGEVALGESKPEQSNYPREKKMADVKHYSLMEVRPYLKTQGARLTRARYATTTVREYLSQIQPTSLAEQYLEFHDAHSFYDRVCAGAKHHHWWKGGLADHVREIIGIGIDILDLYPGDFTFTKSDLIIAAYLHDFAKIWSYREIAAEERAKTPTKYKDQQVFTYTDGQFNILNDENKTLLELTRAGIVPSDIQWSAIIFAEGAFSQAMWDFGGRSSTGDKVYSSNHLATLLSGLDAWSAAILGRSLV